MPPLRNPCRSLPPLAIRRHLLAVLLIFAGLRPANGDTLIDNNGVITSPGHLPSGWSPTGTFFIGQNGNGTLSIDSGFVVAGLSSDAILGYNQHAFGLVKVNNGALWQAKSIVAGYYGKGTIQLDHDAALKVAESILLGQKASSIGRLEALNGATVEAQSITVGFDQGQGFLTVGAYSKVYLDFMNVGANGGVGTVALSGTGALISISGNLNFGTKLGGAILSVSGGARLETGAANSELTHYSGNTSFTKIELSGAGTEWTNAGSFNLAGANYSSGENSSLSITSGASFTTNSASIGVTYGRPTALVSGANSRMTVQEDLMIGNSNDFSSVGTLTVESGGSVSAKTTYIGMSRSNDTDVNRINVRGAGSRMTSSVSLNVGYKINGELNIEDGAVVTSPLVRISVDVMNDNAATGRITVKGTSVRRGVLETQGIEMVEARGALTIDGGIIRATASNGDFLRGFSNNSDTNGVLKIESGGAFFDSNGFDIGIFSRAVGNGALTKLGAGSVTLGGNQGYTGTTYVDQGVLMLTGTLASSAVAINGGSFRLSNSAGLGGQITGAGVFEIGSGTSIFTGTATHAGGTKVFGGGTLQIGNAGNTGSVSGAIDVAGTLVFKRAASADALRAGTLTGAGTVRIDGGNIVFDAQNTFSGSLVLNGGWLGIGSSSSLGELGLSANRPTIIASGGGLRADGAPRNIVNNIELNGTLYLGRLTNLDGAISLRSDSTIISSNIGSGSANQSTINGVISNGGADGNHYKLTFAEGVNPIGKIILAGNNTYTGGTYINGGTVALGASERLADAGSLFVNGGTFDLGAYHERVDIFTLAGGALAGTGTLFANTFNLISGDTQSVTLGGDGVLKKSGGGTFALTHANTYAGGTIVQEGTLSLGAGGVLGATGTISMTGGALQFTSANTTDYSSRFSTDAGQQFKIDTNGQNISFNTGLSSSGGILTKLGEGTLTLNGDNFYGKTVISQGTLQIGNGGSTGVIRGNIENHGTLIFNRSTESTYADVFNGAGTVIKRGAGKLILEGESMMQGLLSIEDGEIFTSNKRITGNGLIVGAAASGLGNAALTITGASSQYTSGVEIYVGRYSKGTLNIEGGADIYNYSNSVIGEAGIGTVNASGWGTMWWHSGSIRVGSSGTGYFNLSDGAAAVSANAVIGFDAGGMGSAVVTGLYTVWTVNDHLDIGRMGTGSLTIGDQGIVEVNNGSGTIMLGLQGAAGGTLTLGVDNGEYIYNLRAATISGGEGTGAKQVIFNTSSTVPFNIKITGSASVVLNGTGDIRFETASDYSGTTTIHRGKFSANNNGMFSGNSAFILGNAADAFLIVGGFSQTIGSLSGGGATGGAVTINTGGVLTLGGNNASTTFDGVIKGSSDGQLASMIKKGSGTFTLGGAADNANLGATVDGGTLVLGKASSSTVHAISRDVAVNLGATLRLAGTGGDQIAKSAAVTLNSGGIFDLNGLSESFKSLLGTGSVTNSAAATTSLLTLGEEDASFTFSGNFLDGAGAAKLGLTKVGSGTLVLGGTNSYSGATTLAGGLLTLAAASGLSPNSALTIAADATLNLAGFSATSGSLAGEGFVTLGSGTLSVNQVGATTYAGSITGTGGLAKLGAGALTLSGASTFGGALSPNAGTLNITGSVTSGGTSGVGATGGNATVNITGAGAKWTNAADTLFGSGNGTGNLIISGGGTAGDTFALVGRHAGGTGNITVTGPGSMWTHSAGLVIGTGGSGTMLVSAGGQVSNSDGTLGGDGGSSGTVRVTGAGSLWASSAYLRVGSAGTGVLNVDDGGTVKVGASGMGTLTLANSNAAAGTLNIGAAAGEAALAPGTIQAATVTGGSGSGAKLVNFNHTGTAYIFAANLTGSLSLLQNGGVTILTGVNTYDGGTIINAGTLTLSGGSALADSGSVTLANTAGATLALADSETIGFLAGGGSAGGNVYLGSSTLTTGGNDATTTFAGALSGTGSLTKTGEYTLTLTGNSSYTGGTTLEWGTLILGSANALGTSGTIRFTGGTLQYTETNTADYSSRFSTEAYQQYRIDTNGQHVTFASHFASEQGSFAKLGDGTLTVTGSIATTGNTPYIHGITISGGTLSIGNGGETGSISGIITNDGALIFNRSNALTYGGTISGSGTLTKLGAGTLTLTANNINYIGAMTISEGTLAIGSGGTTGLINTSQITNNGALVFNRSNMLTFGGAISGGGSVTKLGGGTLTLNGYNTYTGGTIISAGTLAFGFYGTIAETGSVTVGGGTFNLGNNRNQTIGALTVTSGSITGTGTSSLAVSSLSGAGGAVSLSSLTSRQGGDTTFSGVLIGTELILDGPGTLTLDGDGDNVAATATVLSGTLVLAKAGTPLMTHAIGNGLTIHNGGTVRLGGSTGDQIFHAAPVTLNTGGTFDLNGRDESLGVFTGGGTVTNTAAGKVSTLTLGENTSASASFTFSGTLQNGAGALALVKTGAGALTLTAANTYTGGTTIDGGTLIAARNGEYGTFTAGSTVTVNAGGTLQVNGSDALGWGVGNARLVIHGGTVTTDGTAGQHTSLQNVTMTGGWLTDQGDNGHYFLNGTLVTNPSATTAVIDSKQFELGSGWTPGSASITVAKGSTANGIDLDISSTLIGNGPLVKKGTGTLRLSGADHSYTGATVVEAGLFLLNGDFSAATGDVTVRADATLGGSGIIGGAVVVESGGKLAPGNSPGRLTLLDDLTLHHGSFLEIEIGGITDGLYDQIDVQGIFTAGGTLHLLLIDDFTLRAGDELFLFDGNTPGIDVGSFDFITTNLGDGLEWNTSRLASDGIVTVQVQAVPEPGIMALLVVGLGMLAFHTRRRKRRDELL